LKKNNKLLKISKKLFKQINNLSNLIKKNLKNSNLSTTKKNNILKENLPLYSQSLIELINLKESKKEKKTIPLQHLPVDYSEELAQWRDILQQK
jgi:ribulose kinase